MAALLPTTLLGKGEVAYPRLQSFYSNAGMVAIDKVVLSDTATVMYCTALSREGGCGADLGREMLYSESRAVGVPFAL